MADGIYWFIYVIFLLRCSKGRQGADPNAVLLFNIIHKVNTKTSKNKKDTNITLTTTDTRQRKHCGIQYIHKVKRANKTHLGGNQHGTNEQKTTNDYKTGQETAKKLKSKLPGKTRTWSLQFHPMFLCLFSQMGIWVNEMI